MSDKKIKKLKRKIWIISTIVLIVYIYLLIVNPTIWSILLPIIIASSSLTIGIPVYNNFIKKNDKENMKIKTQEYIDNFISNNKTIEKEETKNNYNNHLSIEEINSVGGELDRPKIKTKGTIK